MKALLTFLHSTTAPVLPISLRLLFIFLIHLPISLPAGTFELNQVRGLWQFNNSLAPVHTLVQSPVYPTGFTIGSAPNSRYLTESLNTFLAVNSSTSPFSGLKPSEVLHMPLSSAGNGPAGYLVHEWTLIMDVRFPALSTWTALTQDRTDNSDEGEIFLNPARELVFYNASGPSGLHPIASPPLAPNTWYRLAFTSTWDGPNNRQILRAYVNGTLTTQSSGGNFTSPAYSEYALGSHLGLFTDDSNSTETAISHLGSLAFWRRALSAMDISDIGSHSAAGITWPSITPANGTPPLPPLTGVIRFGDFNANYTPPTGAALLTLAQQATATSYSGALCEIPLDISGTVSASGNHTFSYNSSVAVLPNGDVVALEDAALTFTPPPGQPNIDAAESNGISIIRANLVLDHLNGLMARNLILFLPAGMTVTPSAGAHRGIDFSSLLMVPLNQSLFIKNSMPLTEFNFFGTNNGSSSIHVHTERVATRFPTNTITFNPASASFTFVPSVAEPNRLAQFRRVRSLSSLGSSIKNLAAPASNDFYFTGAFTTNGSVTLGARAGGISIPQTLSLNLSRVINPLTGDTTTHFPKTTIAWTGDGVLNYASGAIDASTSRLPSNLAATGGYLRGTPTADCVGDLSANFPQRANYSILSRAGLFTFTRDGGLSGECDLTSNGSASFFPRWGGYRLNGSDFFAHQLSTAVPTARFLTAGTHAIGNQISSTTLANQRPAAMLFSGHSSPSNSTLVERPNTPSYHTGAADYPGLNLRNISADWVAISRLADTQTPAYSLAASTKYYIRNSGLSGKHLSSGPPIALNAYGSTFNLSALALAFLSGVNTESGVTGGVLVRTPLNTSFSLDFRKLKFGPQGQLQESTLSANQPDKNLGYWKFKFSPLALDFPQAPGCPPNPGSGYVRISARAVLPAFTTTPVTGTLGFLNSDLVTAATPEAGNTPNISRFDPGSQLKVPGPSTPWLVNSTSGIYLNQYASSGGDAGSLNAGGLLDLPFFDSMPVHLRTASITGASQPLIHVRKALSTTAAYDLSHRGKPDDQPDQSYHNTAAIYDPIAYRKWQNLLTFELPVAFTPGANIFRSKAPVTQATLIFQTSRMIPRMTPAHAEVILDGQADIGVESFLKQLNVSSLLAGTPLTGAASFASSATSAVNSINSVLTDNLQPLLAPALTTTANSRVTTSFFNTLKTSPNRTLTIDTLFTGLSADVRSIFSTSESGIAGQTRREIVQKLDQADTALLTASTAISTVTAAKNLATAIGAAIGEGNSPIDPNPDKLADLSALFLRARSDILAARNSLGSPLNTAMNSGAGQVDAAISLALQDLRVKWAPTSAAQATALYNGTTAADFSEDLATALTDRIAGASFAAQANDLLKQYLDNARGLARQSLDEAIALAAELLQGTGTSPPIPGSGTLSGSIAAANLKGYARFKGDSIDELRIDAKATLKVPDDMDFTAFFLLKTVDSSTPSGACLAAGGAAAEVSMGASTNAFSWGPKSLDVSLGGKIALDANASPIGLFGDLKLLGDMDFSEVKMQELALGFGFGANNYYLYGKGAGKISAMDIAAGIFVGRTCELAPIQNADPDIGKVVALANLAPPYTGISIYAYGGMSLMPIIGIPPSCLLDLRVGGGQGFFAFESPAGIVAGVKNTQAVSGELLCISSVKGQQDTVIAGQGEISAGGTPKLNGVTGTSKFTLSGKVGVGWLSYNFSKSVGLKVSATPFVWGIDY